MSLNNLFTLTFNVIYVSACMYVGLPDSRFQLQLPWSSVGGRPICNIKAIHVMTFQLHWYAIIANCVYVSCLLRANTWCAGQHNTSSTVRPDRTFPFLQLFVDSNSGRQEALYFGQHRPACRWNKHHQRSRARWRPIRSLYPADVN